MEEGMHWYADWDSGWIWGMHLVWWLFWIIVAIGAWWAVTRGKASSPAAIEPPLEVLRRRYAEGALTTEQFEERRKVLASGPQP
jgi:putative membrane protein